MTGSLRKKQKIYNNNGKNTNKTKGGTPQLKIMSHTDPFDRGVHRNAYITISLRRDDLGRMHGIDAGGGGRLQLAGRNRGQSFVGHLIYTGFPRRESVQRRRRGFVGLLPRQFFPAGRVDFRVVVREVRLDAHGLCCKTRIELLIPNSKVLRPNAN